MKKWGRERRMGERVGAERKEGEEEFTLDNHTVNQMLKQKTLCVRVCSAVYVVVEAVSQSVGQSVIGQIKADAHYQQGFCQLDEPQQSLEL